MAQKFIVPITIKQLASAGSDALTVFVDQENVARVKIDAGGKISWSDGSTSSDTNLFRAASGAIATPGAFAASGGLQTSVVSASPTSVVPDGSITVDTLNNFLYFRSSGAWVAAGTGTGGGASTLDGGTASSVYGGVDSIDGEGA